MSRIAGEEEYLRRKDLLIALLGVIVPIPAAFVETALATPSKGVTAAILGRGTVAPFHIETQSKDFVVAGRKSADLVMAQITIAVGGTTGWHTHHGPIFAFMKSGHLAITRVQGPSGCELTNYGPGDALVEIPDIVHIGRNVGTVPVVLLATYTDVPIGGATATSVPAATTCR